MIERWGWVGGGHWRPGITTQIWILPASWWIFKFCRSALNCIIHIFPLLKAFWIHCFVNKWLHLFWCTISSGLVLVWICVTFAPEFLILLLLPLCVLRRISPSLPASLYNFFFSPSYLLAKSTESWTKLNVSSISSWTTF